MSESSLVLSEVHGPVGHIILNRPEALNSLNLEMVRAMHGQLAQWAEDEAIKAVILRGNGERAFCAGGDIRSLYDSFLAEDGMYVDFFVEEYALDEFIHNYPKPFIALMHGYVLGGGMGLVQGASVRVVSEKARLGMPEVGIGYFPDVGGSYFLPRLPHKFGYWMGITGQHVNAADSLAVELADVFISSHNFAAFSQALAQADWSQGSAEAVVSQVVEDFAEPLPEDVKETVHLPLIKKHFGHSSVQQIVASLEAEEEQKAWAQNTLKVMRSRSPLAMAVTLSLLRHGESLTLRQCFDLEIHLDKQWFSKGNIMEGVRALIVDKDKNPQWEPATIEEVEDAQVAAFFSDFTPQ